MTDPRTTAWLDQEDTHLAQLIRAHHWVVQYVSPRRRGRRQQRLPVRLHVGLFGPGHPELVVAGLVADGRDLLPGAADLAAPRRHAPWDAGHPCGPEGRPRPGAWRA